MVSAKKNTKVIVTYEIIVIKNTTKQTSSLITRGSHLYSPPPCTHLNVKVSKNKIKTVSIQDCSFEHSFNMKRK